MKLQPLLILGIASTLLSSGMASADGGGHKEVLPDETIVGISLLSSLITYFLIPKISKFELNNEQRLVSSLIMFTVVVHAILGIDDLKLLAGAAGFLGSHLADKLSKMGEFQSLKQIEGLEMASISADLYNDGRDDLALFYFKEGANYATLNTTNSIVSETITWNEKSNKKVIKALMVNTKNANTFTGKQGYEAIDLVAKSLAKNLTLRESKTVSYTHLTLPTKRIV